MTKDTEHETDGVEPSLENLPGLIRQRSALFDSRHEGACRLLNGFTEGVPHVAIDLFATTAVVYDRGTPAGGSEALVAVLRDALPWLRCIVVKPRAAADARTRRGGVVWGEHPSRKVREHGVWYSVDPLASLDAGLFLDTRNLRGWLVENAGGLSVLNTFAYTGSLGIAARAGGARRVVHVDINREHLNVAKTSCTLNGFAVDRKDFLGMDFFPAVSRLKQEDALFDCVVVDPPFFSETFGGRVDLVNESERLLNKVRPLVGDGGRLIAINNALFVSGDAWMRVLARVCADGYLSVERLIPVPDDFIGYGGPPVRWPADPAPFNHPTKIAILEVRRKDGRKA